MNTLQNRTFFIIILLPVLFLSQTSCRSGKETSATKHENTSSASSAKISVKYAKLLEVNESNIRNLPLYSFIDEWYGVPYKYGGSNKNGIDCSNFTSTLYRNIYNKSLTGSSAGIFDQCEAISKKNLKEGDLVFFKIEGNRISHIGIYLQNNKFVHATTKKGVMIDDLDMPYYKKYFYKAGRLK